MFKAIKRANWTPTKDSRVYQDDVTGCFWECRKMDIMDLDLGSVSNTSILSLLECPVCLDHITPPIKQCTKGHLVCIDCFPSCITVQHAVAISRKGLTKKTPIMLLTPFQYNLPEHCSTVQSNFTVHIHADIVGRSENCNLLIAHIQYIGPESMAARYAYGISLFDANNRRTGHKFEGLVSSTLKALESQCAKDDVFMRAAQQLQPQFVERGFHKPNLSCLNIAYYIQEVYIYTIIFYTGK
ncbi:SIAH1 [Lepeophtheirus salmonis]|uniref:SIAH1 n=1 Tax=Lepeophtheirus salmonis TaxID=72036 RepID=A0A7R8H5I4_LEPSM|nr:SIAH1 [Lepeophtheirus salmonis]CAF2876940.1 SIAH1 [Lepeophtheirus salmonis]